MIWAPMSVYSWLRGIILYNCLKSVPLDPSCHQEHVDIFLQDDCTYSEAFGTMDVPVFCTGLDLFYNIHFPKRYRLCHWKTFFKVIMCKLNLFLRDPLQPDKRKLLHLNYCGLKSRFLWFFNVFNEHWSSPNQFQLPHCWSLLFLELQSVASVGYSWC